MEEVLKRLLENKSEKHRAFFIRLTKTKYEVIGIPVPIIKKMAKEYSKSEYVNEILSFKTNYYEYVLLQGLIISYTKTSDENKLKLLNDFALKIDDWAICDTLCCSIKLKGDLFFNQCLVWTKSNEEFVCRFGVINLMSHYIIDEYVDRAIDNVLKVKKDDYYVEMALAWFVQKLYFKYKEKAQYILDNNLVSISVKKKAEQKIRDSLRERKGAK